MYGQRLFIVVNPWRACARVTVLGLCVLCVSVWLSVCPAPRVLPLSATARPTEGTYGYKLPGIVRHRATSLLAIQAFAL